MMSGKSEYYRKLDVILDETAIIELSAALRSIIPSGKPVLFVCIGTDRSTGDALGPMVGSKLQSIGYDVSGILHDPTHAVNLVERMEQLKTCYPGHFIIAIDACLGKLSSVGSVIVDIGPLYPGAGVNKKLPPVGDAHITGIVNVGGFMEYFVLQNTRLSLVMDMAERIADICRMSVPVISTVLEAK